MMYLIASGPALQEAMFEKQTNISIEIQSLKINRYLIAIGPPGGDEEDGNPSERPEWVYFQVSFYGCTTLGERRIKFRGIFFFKEIELLF
jgi:hypothetical protein